ncbi:MAG TPA: bifunctional ADP-heptose synthase [Pyrinomonadaceae bacterium]|jgi:rfaE bifunctional protein kinase chain/domain|nr:bifunctional ADP-heptose synthase [Pyrinomonadaceae bacterium]
MMETNKERLVEVVRRFAGQRILIVGDAIADKFLHGSISRVSREAPVFILRHEQTETLPGGAANCAMNLVALGAQVSLISVTGDDESGSELRAKLEAAGVDINGVIVSDKIQTTTKVRILAGHSHSSKQQVIRIDYEGASLNDEEIRTAILSKLEKAITAARAVVMSDYNYGVVDSGAAELIRETAAVPVLVDSRFRLTDFTGFTAATPNQDEVENLTGAPISSEEELESAARELKHRLGHSALLVTRGGEGMTLLEGEDTLHIRAVGAQQPVDVTGAGDTVIATFALALASHASFADAASLANYAGGLVVMKRGTATVSSAELEHAIIG